MNNSYFSDNSKIEMMKKPLIKRFFFEMFFIFYQLKYESKLLK